MFAATPGSFDEVLKTSSDGAQMLGAPSSLRIGTIRSQTLRCVPLYKMDPLAE